MSNTTNKIIEVTVSPRGDTTVQTKGFAGTECRNASEFLELALGKRQAERITPEFFHTRVTGSAHQQNGQA